MSLAHKLWKIGNVLTKEDVEKSIRVEAGFKEGVEPVYLNIDFAFENDVISKISLNKNAISKDKLFFTKKIGGTSNAYYLFPNISIQNDKPTKGINNLKNTLKYSTKYFCDKKYKNHIDKIQVLLEDVCNRFKLNEYPKENYIILISINGKSFYEIMPEVWENFYKHPFTETKTQKGYDIFTNKETEVGYKTDFRVFSYDQYDKSLKHRLNDNLPLSKESAKNIKYAWKFILDNLLFYYKGLQYIVIPNILNDNEEMLKTVLQRLVIANKKLSKKKTILEKLKKEEDTLKKELEKLQKKKKEDPKKEQNLKRIQQEINGTDLGIINELNEQVQPINNDINEVTLDYLVVTINKTNLSFEIAGTLEDVIPSRMSKIVNLMREYKIEDLVKLGMKDRGKTYLQDYFNRKELYYALNRKTKDNLNSINSERIYLAKLLLTDIKIKNSDLLQRFEYNRNYGYDKKKRITKEGFQEWIQYPDSFVKDEKNLLKFFNSLKKIQED